jgi:hypothetical protein
MAALASTSICIVGPDVQALRVLAMVQQRRLEQQQAELAANNQERPMQALLARMEAWGTADTDAGQERPAGGCCESMHVRFILPCDTGRKLGPPGGASYGGAAHCEGLQEPNGAVQQLQDACHQQLQPTQAQARQQPMLSQLLAKLDRHASAVSQLAGRELLPGVAVVTAIFAAKMKSSAAQPGTPPVASALAAQAASK